MELLTGKALDDFNMWLLKEGNETIVNGTIEYDLYYMCKYMIPESMVCAKVIEWLDSVGIYISVDATFGEFSSYVNLKDERSVEYTHAITRKEATKQAIIHANKIYNER